MGKKNKTPDTTMPLVRAVEEWTSRGDIPNSSTDGDSIANLDSGVNGTLPLSRIFQDKDENPAKIRTPR